MALSLLPASLLAQKGPDGKPFKSGVAPAFDNDPIKVTPVRDGVQVITGIGGNVLLLAADGETLVIDTGVPTRGKELLAAVHKAGARNRITVVNTHFHFDHTGGNAAFGEAHAEIVSHAQTRTRLGSPQTIEFASFTVPAYDKVAWPTTTFQSDLTLYRADTALTITHVPAAHTDTDSYVFLPDKNILHMGDLFFNGFYPLVDYSSNGWLGGYLPAIDQALTLTNADTMIFPGHGPVAHAADLRASRDMLSAVYEKIRPLVEKGMDPNDIAAAKPTAEFDAKWGKGLLNGDTFALVAAAGIKKHLAI